MEIQEWASVVSAVVAVLSAVAATVERGKAAKSAKQALDAQKETAKANAKLARFQEISNARETNRLLLSFNEYKDKILVFNPFPHEVRNLELDSYEIANSPVTIRVIEPQSEKEVFLKPDKVLQSRLWHGSVKLSWKGTNGENYRQSWDF